MKIYQEHYTVTVETDTDSKAGQLVDEVASLINEYVEYEGASGDYEISFTVGSSLSAKQGSTEIEVTFTGNETSGEVMEVLAPYIVAMYDQQDSDFNDDETGYLIDIGVSLSADPAYVARIPTREDPEITTLLQAESLLTEFNRRTGSLDEFAREIANQVKTLEDLETSIARQTTVLESLRARIQMTESEGVSKVVGQFTALSTQLEELVAFVESHSKVGAALEVKSQGSVPLAALGKVFRLINLVNGARIKRLHELIVREIQSGESSLDMDMMTRLLKWMVSIINLNKDRKLEFSDPIELPFDRETMIILPEDASTQGRVSEVLLLGIPRLKLKSLVSVADSRRGP